jgi:hypothetical protein
LSEDFPDFLKNLWLAVPASFVVVMAVGWFYPSGWEIVFSFALGFVSCDLIVAWFIVSDQYGRRAWGSGRFTAKGESYIAFFVAVVVASAGSDFLTNHVSFPASDFSALPTLALLSAILVGMVFYDFYRQFG